LLIVLSNQTFSGSKITNFLLLLPAAGVAARHFSWYFHCISLIRNSILTFGRFLPKFLFRKSLAEQIVVYVSCANAEVPFSAPVVREQQCNEMQR